MDTGRFEILQRFLAEVEAKTTERSEAGPTDRWHIGGLAFPMTNQHEPNLYLRTASINSVASKIFAVLHCEPL